ncbi:brca1-associated ring domain protein 1 [Nannochloropsis gaditana]|uniref:Brca1-associated ring domain protein 1 n=1 Tax=Nannochloropsis gaditana TaxID=72520 RepID=W7TVK5_9STRA|nr:brca1-associated ring domain protein 1 [Nannochloropsis gaditana]
MLKRGTSGENDEGAGTRAKDGKEEEEEGEEAEEEEDSDGEPGGRLRRRVPPVPFVVGDTVEVAARTWPGINKEGGVARIVAVHGAEGGREGGAEGGREGGAEGGCITYDVKYMLSGGEKRVKGKYISSANVLVAPTAAECRPDGAGRGRGGGGGRAGGRAAWTEHAPPVPAKGGETTEGRVHVHTSRGTVGGGHASPSPFSSRKRPADAMTADAASSPPSPSRPSTTPSHSKPSAVLSPLQWALRPALSFSASSSPLPSRPQAPCLPSRPSQASAPRRLPEPDPDPADRDSYRTHPQDIVILPTSLPHSLLGSLDAFARRFDARVTKLPGPQVTHVLARADGRRRAETRTIKYLHGILARRWVLAPSWLTGSLAKGKVEAEIRHEIVGDPKATEPSAPTKARLSRYKQIPPLFAAYRVVFGGDFPPPRPTRRDLESLVKAGGGRVVTLAAFEREEREEEEEIGHRLTEGGEEGRVTRKTVMICNSLPAKEAVGAVKSGTMTVSAWAEGGRPVVSSDWLLDSISNYRVMDLKRFAVIRPRGRQEQGNT